METVLFSQFHGTQSAGLIHIYMPAEGYMQVHHGSKRA